jgi:hypothetical protein
VLDDGHGTDQSPVGVGQPESPLGWVSRLGEVRQDADNAALEGEIEAQFLSAEDAV